MSSEVPPLLTDLAAWVAVLAVIGAPLGVLARSVLKLLNLVRQLQDLAARELTHNRGTSMKDDLHGVALALGSLQRAHDDLTNQVIDLTTRFDAHVLQETP